MSKKFRGGAATVYSSPNTFRIRRPYGRLSLTIDDWTLIATDQDGRRHHIRLGDQPGQVLKVGTWGVITDPGTEGQRLRDCWVAVDVDDQPLLIVYPTVDWTDVGTWCRLHGIPQWSDPDDPGAVGDDPVAARKLVELSPAEAPLRAGPDTVVLEKESAETRDLWRVSGLLLLGPWVLAAWMALSSGIGIPPWLGWPGPAVAYVGGFLTLILGTRRVLRLEDEQCRRLADIRPDEPPPPHPRPPRPGPPTPEESRRLAEIRRHAALRPRPPFLARTDAFARNVSVRLAERTVVLTDESGNEHRFPLGDRPGQFYGLDLCERVRKRDSPPAGRYLVGIDADRTALFAITPLRRFRQTEVQTWARLHHLPLTDSPVIYYIDPETDDPLAIETPDHISTTLLIGNRRSGWRRWELTALTWTAAIIWAPVAYYLLGLPIWTIPLPLGGLAAYTFHHIRRHMQVRHARTEELNTWQLALTISDGPGRGEDGPGG